MGGGYSVINRGVREWVWPGTNHGGLGHSHGWTHNKRSLNKTYLIKYVGNYVVSNWFHIFVFIFVYVICHVLRFLNLFRVFLVFPFVFSLSFCLVIICRVCVVQQYGIIVYISKLPTVRWKCSCLQTRNRHSRVNSLLTIAYMTSQA